MNPASDGALLRAVVYTNVYISAFLYPQRAILQIVHQAARRQYHLLISSDIIQEVGRVMREDLGWEEYVRIRHLKNFVKAAKIVISRLTLAIIREDPPDNRILECAVDGRANLIVSGDRHLAASKSTKASLLSGRSIFCGRWESLNEPTGVALKPNDACYLSGHCAKYVTAWTSCLPAMSDQPLRCDCRWRL